VGGVTDFLLELRSEEIPARMQTKAREDLERLFAAQLADAGIAAESIETFATPRRLALIARGLPPATEAVSEERRGPRSDAPDKAIEGFARGAGVSRDALVEREEKKGAFLYAVIDTPGRETKAVLGEAIPEIIRGFPWPKAMRWGDASASSESLRWVRPLHGIVAILGDALVETEVDGIVSGVETRGHRFHHPGPITIGGAGDYAEKLRACHVIVDPAEREGIIRARAAALAEAAGLTRVHDTGLVTENAGLTEWPVPLLGRFDEAFLEVPPEVITLTMRTNQKYFALTRPDGSLAPNFICVANIEAADEGAHVVAGNQKVLAARLADARFFWEQDLKTPLEEQAKKLDQIVFHEKLGTVADKVERVAKLARWLVEEGIVSSNTVSPELVEGRLADEKRASTGSAPTGQGREALADLAETAARLAKADLVTGMVGEFPDLQGVIGGYYAAAQGHDPQIAAAIRDHYKPVGQGDEVPTDPVTVAVSLADKLDTIASFFRIGETPTGSKDPFALRRSAIGIARLVVENHIRLRMLEAMAVQAGIEEGLENELLEYGVSEAIGPLMRQAAQSMSVALERLPDQLAQLKESLPAVLRGMQGALSKLPETMSFLTDRLKVQQRDAGVRHDLIDAVFALGGEDDLVRLLARVKALQDFLGSYDGANLLAGYKRAANILKKEGRGDPASVAPAKAGASTSGEQRREISASAGMTELGYDPEPEEALLIAALDTVVPKADAAIATEDFEGAMAALAELRSPIDAFFDNVTVNDENEQKRNKRLGMLEKIRDAVHRVADFSRIEG